MNEQHGPWFSGILIRLMLVSLLFSATHGHGAANASKRVPDTLVKAPSFTLPVVTNAQTETLSLADSAGKVVYVDFWASWCGPCRLSLPALDELYQDLHSDGLDVVAVSVDVVEEDSLDFLKRYPVTYPVVIDTNGAVPREWAVNGMPSGYLIDKQGNVREVHVGFKRGDEVGLRASIEALLAE